MKRWAVLPIAMMWACAGTSATPVRGPDGRKALLIEAPTQLDALRLAHEKCPDGYDILNSTTSLMGPPRFTSGTTIEMLISCTWQGAGQSEWYAAPDPNPCGSVASEVDDFAEYWAAFSRAEPVDPSPQGSAFVELCESMPPHVQLCFKKDYRKAHEKMCKELFVRLDEPRRNKLNAALVR